MYMYPSSPALGKFYIVTDGDTHPEDGTSAALNCHNYPTITDSLRIHIYLQKPLPLIAVVRSVPYILACR